MGYKDTEHFFMCLYVKLFNDQCSKPVIAAIHNACIGGGIDMTAACDIRYCTGDAWFQIKVMSSLLLTWGCCHLKAQVSSFVQIGTCIIGVVVFFNYHVQVLPIFIILIKMY